MGKAIKSLPSTQPGPSKQDIENALDDKDYVAEQLQLANAAHAADPTTATQYRVNACLARTRETQSILSQSAPSKQRPGEAIAIRSQTIRQGEIVAAGHIARWLIRPHTHAARLDRCDPVDRRLSYRPSRSSRTMARPRLAGHRPAHVGRQALPPHDRPGRHACAIAPITSTATASSASTSRPSSKALDQLEEMERAEWELMEASAALDQMSAEAPF